MASATDRAFWKEFLALYRAHPVLWNIKSDSYKNNNLRLEGYTVLLQKMKEVDKDATVDSIKRKINCLRSSFRRELNKVRSGEKSGNLYSPTLWYYEDLVFLKDQEIDSKFQKQEIEYSMEFSFQDQEIDSRIQDPIMEPEDEKRKSLDKLASLTNNWKKAKRKTNTTREKPNTIYLKKPVRLFNNDNDEAGTLGKCWAMKYRKLSHRQQIFAIKAIDDIFYQGFLGKLCEESLEPEQIESPSKSYSRRSSTPHSRESCNSSRGSRLSPFFVPVRKYEES